MSDGLLFPATLVWCVVAALLGVLAAAAELVGRFKDAPGSALRSTPGMACLALNGALAGLVLLGLRYVDAPDGTFGLVAQLLLAGYVTRTLVRMKITGPKGSDGTITETGPGQFSEKLLAAIARELDRERANQRLRNVSERLMGVEYAHAFGFFVSELMASMQDLTEEDKRDIGEALRVIDARKDLDDATRVDMLGYLVLDYAGEEYLEQLVSLYHVRFPARGVTVRVAA